MSASPPTQWSDYARELGSRIQQHRKDAGLSQEDLAHQAGLTRTHFQQIERGLWKVGSPSNPSIRTLARLAQVLGVEVGDLLPPVAGLAWGD